MRNFLQNFTTNWLEYLLVIIIASFLEIIVLFLTQISFWYLIGFIFGIIFIAILSWSFSISLGILLIALLAGQLIRIKIPGSEGGAILLLDIVVPIVVLAWILRRLFERKTRKINFLALPIVSFVIIAGFSFILGSSALQTNEIMISFFYLARWIAYAGIYFVIADRASEKDFRKILWILVIAGLIFALGGIWQYIYFPNFSQMAALAGWDPHYYRVLSSFFDPNFAGGFLAMILLLILYLMFTAKKWEEKFGLFIIFLPILLAFILTYSRSSYLAFAIMLSFIGLVRYPKIFLAGTIIALVVIFSFPKAVQRIEGARKIDVTASARIQSWQKAWQIITDYPVFGVGYNAFAFVQQQYGFIETTKVHSAAGSDSSLLTILATTGFLGLGAYLAIWLVLMAKSWQIFKRRSPYQYFGLIFLTIILGLFAHSQFVNSLLYPAIMIYIWILAGLLNVIVYKENLSTNLLS